MPGSRITLDLQGRPVVPNDPLVVFIDGDGPGPELVRIAREAVDRAVTAAYGGARRISWVPALAGERARREKGAVTPEATLNEVRRHRLALVGPIKRQPGTRHVVDELARLLDLWFELAWVRTPARADGSGALDLVLFADAADDLAAGVEFLPGSAPVAPLLKVLGKPPEGAAEAVSTPVDRLPFGTAARANAYREAQGDLPTGVPPTGLVIRHTAPQSAQRLAPQLAAWCRRLARPTLLVADEKALQPVVGASARRWLEERLAAEPGVQVGSASEEPTDAALTVTFAEWPTLLRATLSQAPPPAIAAPAVTARRLRHLLVDRGGGDAHVPVARLDPTAASGICTVLDPAPDATWDAATPLPWVLAGALLLDTLGWQDAARELRTACDAVTDAGQWPQQLAHDLALAEGERLGTAAWARALQGQFA